MHPIALKIGGLTIHWYGVFVAVGFLAGIWTATFRARTIGVKPETIMDFGIWMIVAGILGARLFYVIGNWEQEFAGHPIEIVRIDKGGLVFYGGFVGAVLASIWFVRRNKLTFWKLADMGAPSLALGHAIGRLGCFMNGCCFGGVCSLPWAVHYPAGSDPFRTQVNEGLILSVAKTSLGVHPTQLYESLGNLLIFAGLTWFYSKRTFDGQVFWLYVLLYAMLRFTVEFFRGDWDVHFLGGWISPGHIMAICVFGIGLFFLWYLRRRMKATGAAA